MTMGLTPAVARGRGREEEVSEWSNEAGAIDECGRGAPV